jgi:hypothetical protein
MEVDSWEPLLNLADGRQQQLLQQAVAAPHLNRNKYKPKAFSKPHDQQPPL